MLEHIISNYGIVPNEIPIEVSNRPFRLAFIVNISISSHTLKRLIEFNSSIWGGFANLFVPTDGTQVRDDWQTMLRVHDPDKLLFIGEIDVDLINYLVQIIQPLEQYQLMNEDEIPIANNTNGINSITWRQLFLSKLRDIGVQISGHTIPLITQPLATDVDYELPFLFAFGRLSTNDLGELDSTDNFLQESISVSTLSEYLAELARFSRLPTPINFTASYLRLLWAGWKSPLPPNEYNDAEYGTAIVIASTVADYLLYHAISLTYRPGNTNVFLIPIELLSTTESIQELAMWLEESFSSPEFITLLKNDNDEDFERVKAILKQVSKVPVYFRNCNFIPSFPEIFEEKNQQFAIIDDSLLKFTLAKTSLHFELTERDRWITEIDIGFTNYSDFSYVPSRFPTINQIFSRVLNRPIPSSNIRMSRNKLAKITSHKFQLDGVRLPTIFALIEGIFEYYQYSCRKGEKGRYYRGLLRLIAGLKEARIFNDKFVRNLVRKYTASLETQRTGLTKDQMLQIARGDVFEGMSAREKVDRIEMYVLSLLKKSVLMRGYTLKCPTCNLNTWYSVTETTKEDVICKGCLSTFQMKADVKFAYKLNQLALMAFTNGAYTVILTLLFLRGLSKKSFLWEVSIETESPEKAEFDIIAMCDGLLVVGECKDHILEDSVEEIVHEIRKDIEFAKKIHADLYVFSTSDSFISQEIIDVLIESNKEELNVFWLDQEELANGYIKTLGSDHKIYQLSFMAPSRQREVDDNCSDDNGRHSPDMFTKLTGRSDIMRIEPKKHQ